MLPISVASQFCSKTTFNKFFKIPKNANIFEKITEYEGEESCSYEGRATPIMSSFDSVKLENISRTNSLQPPPNTFENYKSMRIKLGFMMGEITRFFLKVENTVKGKFYKNKRNGVSIF